MPKPQRIQRKRTKGFDLQRESMALNGLPSVSVTRPSKFGNPFKLPDAMNDETARHHVLAQYEKWLRSQPELMEAVERELCGKNLACFCHCSFLCHADILLRIANS